MYVNVFKYVLKILWCILTYHFMDYFIKPIYYKLLYLSCILLYLFSISLYKVKFTKLDKKNIIFETSVRNR